MKIRFEKMTGAGNDFVIVDNRAGIIADGPGLARKLCDRHFGVGADGLILIENSRSTPYRMMYYNADGSYGGMCGNGGRCVANYAVRTGIAVPRHEFEALDHVYAVDVREDSVRLSMKDPVGLKFDIMLRVGKRRMEVAFVDTGSPHVILEARKVSRKGLEEIRVEELGRQIRNHTRFKPSGTNVNFIELQPDKSIRIRTYERGVEAETLACGTGSIASGIVASELYGIDPPVIVVPRSMRKLRVDFQKAAKGVITGVVLEGPAERVFMGELEIR